MFSFWTFIPLLLLDFILLWHLYSLQQGNLQFFSCFSHLKKKGADLKCTRKNIAFHCIRTRSGSRDCRLFSVFSIDASTLENKFASKFVAVMLSIHTMDGRRKKNVSEYRCKGCGLIEYVRGTVDDIMKGHSHTRLSCARKRTEFYRISLCLSLPNKHTRDDWTNDKWLFLSIFFSSKPKLIG